MPLIVTGSSETSVDAAIDAAFAEIPGDQSKEGLASAEVTRIWVTKGGFVGFRMFNVELTQVPAG